MDGARAAFAAAVRPGATLGIVSGRRRQGKTFLLRVLCKASLAHLERLRRIRALLIAPCRHSAATARLLGFSGAGFTAELWDEAAPAWSITGIFVPGRRG